MSRMLAVALAPEVTVGLMTAGVLVVCARHHSFSDTDVRVLERLLYLLPFLVVLAAFAGTYWVGPHTWLNLGRANLAAMIALVVGGYRIVSGLGAPGSGPKGQDAGFILLLTLGIGLCTLANAVVGSVILRAQKPAVAEWYREHTLAGPLLTIVSMVPILVVQIGLVVVITSVAGMLAGLFKR